MSKSLESVLHNLVRQRLDAADISYCGITKNGYQIPVLLHKSAYDFSGDCARILIIGGGNGTDDDVQLTLDVIETVTNHFNDSNALSISYIPCLDYDAYISSPQTPQTEGKLAHGFPPDGNYFFDPEVPESRYIWRWISYQAPDLVIELSLAESIQFESNEAAPAFIADMDTANPISDDSLIGALGRRHESNLGSIPGIRITGTSEQVASEIVKLLHKVVDARGTDQSSSSPAAATIRRLQDRSAQEVSEALASQFGYKLDSPINYIQGVGVSGRIRLAEYKNQAVPDDIFNLSILTLIIPPPVLAILPVPHRLPGRYGRTICSE